MVYFISRSQGYENDITFVVICLISVDLQSFYLCLKGIADVQFPYRHGGHVKLNGQEICFNTFTKIAGEALCQSKGLKYSSFSRYVLSHNVPNSSSGATPKCS